MILVSAALDHVSDDGETISKPSVRLAKLSWRWIVSCADMMWCALGVLSLELESQSERLSDLTRLL